MSNHLGEVSTLLAAIFWSIAVVIFRSVGNTISAFVVTPAKNFIAIILFGMACIFTGAPIWYEGLSGLEYYKLIISGCLGMGIADLLFLYSLNKIGASRIAILNTLEPFSVLLLSYLMLGGDNQIPNGIQLIGFIIISTAVLSITLEKSPRKDIDAKSYYQGIILMISAILISSFGIVLMKPVLSHLFELGKAQDSQYNSYQLLLWGSMLRLLPGVLITIFVLLSKKNWKELLRPTMNKGMGLKLLLASGLGTFFALNFWIMGYASMDKTALTSILGQTSAIFIIILARIFLKETITPLRAMSMCIAFFGVVLVVSG